MKPAVLLRKLALIYGGTLCIFAAWAWVVDVVLRNSSREHLAPDVIFAASSLPASLARKVCAPATSYCGVQFGQLVLLTFCAAAQAGALLLVARWWGTRHSEKRPC